MNKYVSPVFMAELIVLTHLVRQEAKHLGHPNGFRLNISHKYKIYLSFSISIFPLNSFPVNPHNVYFLILTSCFCNLICTVTPTYVVINYVFIQYLQWLLHVWKKHILQYTWFYPNIIAKYPKNINTVCWHFRDKAVCYSNPVLFSSSIRLQTLSAKFRTADSVGFYASIFFCYV